MLARVSLLTTLLATSAALDAQEQAPPEPSPSEAATQHAPPQGAAAVPPASAAAPKWDVERPRGVTTRKVRLDTNEGTWMNVDVSPKLGGRSASAAAATSR